MSGDAADRLRALAGVARFRNGRLSIDWISRRQKPRWRMVLLNGQYYDRDLIRQLLDRRPPPAQVPASRRRLTPGELADLYDLNPWRLYPPRPTAAPGQLVGLPRRRNSNAPNAPGTPRRSPNL